MLTGDGRTAGSRAKLEMETGAGRFDTPGQYPAIGS
jgi:hypothetical protein